MKTIREHLETLPEPYRTQAIENFKSNEYDDEAPVDNIQSALLMAFDWYTTDQGGKYWRILYKSL